MKSWLKILVVVPVLCFASFPVLGQQQDASQQQTGDPVADAARKAREEKKAEPKPKKVYTDDDVVHSHPDTANQPPPPGGQATPNTEAGAKAGAAGAPGDEKKDDQKNDEASLRKRFKELHARIADAEKELDILQREGVKTQLQYYPDPQKALSEQNTRKDINETYAKIEAKKDEIAKMNKSLSDLEDDLRKAGGDPGWANE